MNCRDSQLALEDLLDDQLDPLHRGALDQHLAQCAACRARLEREKTLRKALRELPVPEPRAGFAGQVLRNATQSTPNRRSGYWPGLALAASLVAGIAVGVLLVGSPATGPAENAVARITMAVEQPQQVNLAFFTETPLENVNMTLHLPEQVELVGYPGQRHLQWHTDLAAGRNRLNLPVVVHGGTGGVLVAELAHERGKRQFQVQIMVAPDRGVWRGAPEPLTKI